MPGRPGPGYGSIVIARKPDGPSAGSSGSSSGSPSGSPSGSSGSSSGADPGRAVRAQEKALLSGLTGWALASLAVGVLAGRAVRGRTTPRGTGPTAATAGADLVAGVARQAVGWAGVDLGIAAWGVLGALRDRRSGALAPQDARRRARRMARITAVNAAADVGYVVAGALLAVRSPRRRGDGLGIVVQGLALLRLDAVHASAFRRLTSAVPDRGVAGPT